MSIQVANVDLSTAVVGTAGSIPLGQSMPPPTIAQQMQPQSVIVAQLVVFNESGCGLTLTFPVTRETLSCPAGGWRQIAVPPNEISLNYQVTYLLPNAPVSQLLVDLYLPGEAPDSIGTLGNSPIGVSGQVATSVNQVVNSDNPAPTLVVQGTPSGSANAELQWNNDGSGTFGGGNDVVDAAGVFTSMPADAIPVAAIGPGALDSDVTIGGGQVTSTVASATAATGASQLTADATHRAIAVWDNTNSRLDIGPDSNVHPQAVALIYRDASGTTRLAFIGNADNSGSVGGPFGLSLAWDASGNLRTIGGVTTVGFGAPILSRQVIRQTVTSTAGATLVSFTQSGAAVYRISGYAAINGTGAAGSNVTWLISYVDADGSGSVANAPFLGWWTSVSNASASSGLVKNINLGTLPGQLSIGPLTVTAGNGAFMIFFQDAAGTPSDTVTVIIERLA